MAALVASVGIAGPGLYILKKYTEEARSKHLLNVFSQLFFALFSIGMVVRLLYFLAFVNPGTPNTSDFGESLSMRAFLLVYPQINVLTCSFLIQYPWLYDFILIQNGRQINLVLRQQMKMFVVAALIFTVLIYVVFLFGFPITDDTDGGKLINLYYTIMVFSIISAILVLCQIMTGARRIGIVNQQFGKLIKY